MTDIPNLSKRQKDVFEKILVFLFNGEKQTMVVSGVAGSGKSTIIKHVDRFLIKAFKNTNNIHHIMAFTGKAAGVLRDKGIERARTIHSVMYIPKIENNRLVGFTKASVDNMEGVFCFMVDEASMVSKEIFDDMLSYGLPIVFFGDREQLPPVTDTGDNIMNHCDVHMDEIHRQAEGNPIILLSKNIRETGSFDKEYFIKNHPDQVRFIKEHDITKTHLADPDNKYNIMLCGTNKRRSRLNTLYRLSDSRFDAPHPCIGETVICLKNTALNTMIYNGETFTVVSVEDTNENCITRQKNMKMPAKVYTITDDKRGFIHKLSVADVCWEDYNIHPSYLGRMADINSRQPHLPPLVPMDFGYAITVHKSQGGEFDDVLFVDENVSSFLDRKKFRYTAVTRAKNRITIATE